MRVANYSPSIHSGVGVNEGGSPFTEYSQWGGVNEGGSQFTKYSQLGGVNEGSSPFTKYSQ